MKWVTREVVVLGGAASETRLWLCRGTREFERNYSLMKNDRFFCEPSRLYTRTLNPAARDVSSVERKVTAEPSRAEPSRAERARARARGVRQPAMWSCCRSSCPVIPALRRAIRAQTEETGEKRVNHRDDREREKAAVRRAAHPLTRSPPHAPPVPLVFMKRSARVCALCVCSCACRVRVCAHANVCVRVCVAAGARGCERVGLCMSP